MNGNLPSRPKKACSLGREVAIRLNTFHVLEFPSKPVHQYDITITSAGNNKGDVPRMVILKVWKSKAVQEKLDRGWVYDGNKLAW
jgi:eukaryotic translation initiation factor 2C